MRFVGVDHSLTSTGLAFAVDDEFTSLRTITSPPGRDGETLDDRADRIGLITRRFNDHVDEFVEDYPQAFGPLVIVLETRDFQTKPREGGHPTDRAGLWMQLMITGRVYGALLVGVAPSTLKVYGTGDGRASKAAVKEAVERTYNLRCRNDDEADAAVLAAMAADHYGTPIAPVGPKRRRTMDRPRWPRIVGAG